MKFQLSDIDATRTLQFDSFGAVLDYDILEYQNPLIRWDGVQEYCALDIDKIPDNVDVYVLTRLVKPIPKWAWVTRSNHGLRAVYHADGMFAADELAALAVWFLREKIPEIKVEFLSRTFYPTEKNQVVRSQQQKVDSSFFDRLFHYIGSSITDESITQYLTERSMEIGKRYPHSLCPINPDRPAERNPVVVNETGIYCFVCASTEKSGFRRFDTLINRESNSDIGSLVKNKTHWEHAKYILNRLTGLNDSMNKKLYMAGLVYEHGKTIRDETIFKEHTNAIRIGSWWGTQAGEVYGDDIKPLLAGLPIARYTDAKGKNKTDETRLTRISQTADITELGYPSFSIVRGIRLYGHYLSGNGKDYSIMTQIGPLRKEEYRHCIPKYVEGDLDVEKAKKQLEVAFPKINWPALYLILSARGCAEGQIGLPAFVYLSGKSGSGKTSLVKIAATILGDYHTEHVWTNNPERVRQGVMGGKQAGMFVSFDEICKNAKKAGVDFIVAMDDALNLTPDSTSHQLYTGPVKLGALPAIFWTDTDIPGELRQSVQLGRRIIHCHLFESMDWETSLYASGVDRIERLRIAGEEYTDACNVILSDVINIFFREKQDLKKIAKQLGFNTILVENEVESFAMLRHFFDTVCDAPSVPMGADAKRWSGDGWKVIDLNTNTPLLEAWDSVKNEDAPKESRICSEADWDKILGVEGPIEFEMQTHGAKIVVRFTKRKPFTTNRGILNGHP